MFTAAGAFDRRRMNNSRGDDHQQEGGNRCTHPGSLMMLSFNAQMVVL
jgi:hypothetical protein